MLVIRSGVLAGLLSLMVLRDASACRGLLHTIIQLHLILGWIQKAGLELLLTLSNSEMATPIPCNPGAHGAPRWGLFSKSIHGEEMQQPFLSEPIGLSDATRWAVWIENDRKVPSS